MPDANGFWTPAEQRAEMVDAEAALHARPRSAEEVAGDLNPEETVEIEAMEKQLAAAAAATNAARRALAAAQDAVPDWRKPIGREQSTIDEAERALPRIARAEEDVLGERNRLHTRIGEARQARRQEAAR
jgi:predicted  nucleic acid-binding Zn-ribbon protein